MYAQPTRLLSPWDSPGKNTGVGCHFLLQGNLPDPGIEPSSKDVSSALAGGLFTTRATWEAAYMDSDPNFHHLFHLLMRLVSICKSQSDLL